MQLPTSVPLSTQRLYPHFPTQLQYFVFLAHTVDLPSVDISCVNAPAKVGFLHEINYCSKNSLIEFTQTVMNLKRDFAPKTLYASSCNWITSCQSFLKLKELKTSLNNERSCSENAEKHKNQIITVLSFCNCIT